MKQKTVTMCLFLIMGLLVVLLMFHANRMMMLYRLNKVEISDVDTDSKELHPLDRLILSNLHFFSQEKTPRDLMLQPDNSVSVDELWVERCEVTQAQFGAFSQWTATHDMTDYRHPQQPEDWVFSSGNKHHRVAGRLQSPVSAVTFFDAFSYCKAAGGRLPTNKEWQAAAMGKQNRLYVWGDQFTYDAWPYMDTVLNTMQSCNSHHNDVTENGIANLSSHVSEWTVGEGNQPAIHGGNGSEQPYAIFSLNFITRYMPPKTRKDFIGFRCVYTMKADKTPWKTAIDSLEVESGKYSIGLPEGSFLPHLIQYFPKHKVVSIPEILDTHADPTAKSVTQREITVEQYQYFLNDLFVRWRFYANENEPVGHGYAPENWSVQLNNYASPVTYIDWWSAYAFAKWAGGRLPTENEWMRMASNGGKTLFPWGNDYIPAAVTLESGLTQPEENIALSMDITDNGIMNLSGNISEWTSSLQPGPTGNRMIVKGGNYMLPGIDTTHVNYTNYFVPHQRSPNTGFRVVFD